MSRYNEFALKLPAAQFPSLVPLALEHSVAVMQVAFKGFAEEAVEAILQGLNETMKI